MPDPSFGLFSFIGHGSPLMRLVLLSIAALEPIQESVFWLDGGRSYFFSPTLKGRIFLGSHQMVNFDLEC